MRETRGAVHDLRELLGDASGSSIAANRCTRCTRCTAMTREPDHTAWTLSDVRVAGLLRIVGRGAYVLQGLLLTPLLLHRLGETDYGLWVLLLALVWLLSFLERALLNTLVQITAGYRAVGALLQARPIVANALLVAITIGSAITLVVLAWGSSLLR